MAVAATIEIRPVWTELANALALPRRGEGAPFVRRLAAGQHEMEFDIFGRRALVT